MEYEGNGDDSPLVGVLALKVRDGGTKVCSSLEHIMEIVIE